MIINAFERFGMELNDASVVKTAVEQFPQFTTGPLEINFSGCIIDYEATSILMDVALKALRDAQPPKELVAVFNINFHERLFLKWLFVGSVLLELNRGTGSDKDIREKIVTGMAKLGVSFSIRIIDSDSGNEIRALTYAKP